jgi:methylated-DNA-[protein]-cysteine S-methyltransferase
LAGKKVQTVYCWQDQYRKLKIYFASSARGAKMVEVRLSELQEDCLEYFEDLFPGSRLIKDRATNAPLVDAVQAALDNRRVDERIPLDLTATPFQSAAWKAIAKIPYGTTKTYSEVAQTIGRPLAARAIGQAMGRNPLPLFFP